MCSPINQPKLSDADYAALVFAAKSPLATEIEDVSRKDCWGTVIPGMRTYKKLEKLGLLYFTEEDPEDEFDWTPMVELTDAGKRALEGNKELL
jgi:hypothetical protein